ncbi:MAG: DUF1883 domain-containing protein [Clostridiales Family XIII bacterium]|jgi:hypothetical protein|nr:DUF1883 domain-containing protein [Clostridiales Family XIII bacterium]
MKYLLYDLGNADAGDSVEVSLGYAANVRILDEANYGLYRGNLPHRFIGGYIERTPYKATIPEGGRWYVILDSGSYFGKIKSLVKLYPCSDEKEVLSPQPKVFEFSPGKALAAEAGVPKNKPRLFVLHSYKDRDSIVQSLADALSVAGISAVFEGYTLEPGDSLEEKLRAGVAKYKFGVLVISRSFARTGWRKSDLAFMKEMLTSDYKEIYPVWHNISRDNVMQHLPDLVGMMPNRPGEKSLDEIVDEIVETMWL